MTYTPPQLPATSVGSPAPLTPVVFSGVSRSEQPAGCLLAVEDLRRLYVALDKKALEATGKFIPSQVRSPGTAEAEFEHLKQQALQLGHLTAIIRGDGGELVVARSADVFAPDYMPHRLLSVSYDNTTGLQSLNVSLPNRLNVYLDFSDPPGFGAYNPWSQPTPNATRIEVSGTDDTWVSATFQEALAFFRRHHRSRRWLHSELAFNLMNWCVGIPAALWATFRVDHWVLSSVAALPGGLRAAADVYLFLLGMLAFRVCFYETRWMFPLVEIEGAKSKALRGVVGTIVTSVLLALLYDVLKTLVLWLHG